MRCFFALDLPATAQAALATVAAQLVGAGAPLRCPHLEQLHVTLKFLGELRPALAEAMATALRAMALPTPLRFSIAGLGCFPPQGAPRVIWAGLHGDLEPLAALARDLEHLAARHGIAPEVRPFTAHVTLARVKTPAGSRRLLARIAELSPAVTSAPFAAPSVTLYRSDLGGEGSRYTVLARAVMTVPG